MSFTEDVKNELARKHRESPKERAAELLALLRMSGSVITGAGGKWGMEFSTSNSAVARRVLISLKKDFGLAPAVMVRQGRRLRKKNVYTLTVLPFEGGSHFLEKMDIWSMGKIHDCEKLTTTEEKQAYLYQLKEAADAEGIILTGGYGNDSTHNISGADPMIVKAAFDKFEKTFQKMNIAGIKLLGGSLYSYWPVDYSLPLNKKEDMKRGIENVRILADMAAEYEITLGMEVLNRFEGYMLNTCEEAVDFVSKIDRPNVKVMLDTFHMNIEEDDIPGAIRLCGDKLAYMHLVDSNRGTPGMGHIPWLEVFKALKDIDYHGAGCVETFNPQRLDEIAPLTYLTRRFADTPEELAEQGLRYLKAARTMVYGV